MVRFSLSPIMALPLAHLPHDHFLPEAFVAKTAVIVFERLVVVVILLLPGVLRRPLRNAINELVDAQRNDEHNGGH